MDNDIQIKNPQQIGEKVNRVVKLLSEYYASLYEETKDLANYETLIDQTKQMVNKKRMSYEASLSGTRNIQNSDMARKTETLYQKKIQECDEQLHELNSCQNDFIGIQHDLQKMIKQAADLSSNGSRIQSKIARILTILQDAV